MKKLLYILILILIEQMSFAQQLPIYSQYLYNKFLINPATAGADGYTSLNITARQQWLGYAEAPRTFSASWQTRILKREYILRENIFNRNIYRPKTDGKVGLGGYVFSDQNGKVQKTGFQFTYSYHFWLQYKTQLSLGMALTGYYFKVDLNSGSFEDPNEPWLDDYNLRKGIFVPDADFGAYLLNPNYDIGFSVAQIFGGAARIGGLAYNKYKMYRHYYLFGSYSFSYGNKLELEPSLLINMSEQLTPLADLGLTLIYDQKLWAGVSFRTPGAAIANFGAAFDINKIKMMSLYIGYSLDFTMNKIQQQTYGTHELTIAMKFGASSKRFRWIDRF